MADQRSHSLNKSKKERSVRAVSLRKNNPIWGFSLPQKLEYLILNEIINIVLGTVRSTLSYVDGR